MTGGGRGLLALDIAQTVVVVVGVIYGGYQVYDLKRTHDATSLEALLTEWRRCADERGIVLKRLPALQGSVEDQVRGFLEWLQEQRQDDGLLDLMTASRKTVNALTDLGAYLESGAMSKRLFFGQVGTHLLMISHLLDPYILLTSAHRGSRWGLRVRRVRWGASNYYFASEVHHDEIVVRDGVIVWPIQRVVQVPKQPWPRWRLIPSKEACHEVDSADMATARRALDAAPLSEDLAGYFA